MAGACIVSSAAPAAPALEQEASSWPVVTHYKSLAIGLQRKYTQALLRFGFFTFLHFWKYRNQIEHKLWNDAYMAKNNGWLPLIYEIYIFTFERQLIEFGFLAIFFFLSFL